MEKIKNDWNLIRLQICDDAVKSNEKFFVFGGICNRTDRIKAMLRSYQMCRSNQQILINWYQQ